MFNVITLIAESVHPFLLLLERNHPVNKINEGKMNKQI